MKPRTLLLLVVAVVLGLSAAYLAAKFFGAKKEEERVAVLIASKEIAQGTYLAEPRDYFVDKEYIKGTEPKGSILKKQEDPNMTVLKGRIVQKTMPEGQFITEADLLPPEKQLHIPTTQGRDKPITKDNRMLAVAVRVTPDTSVAGFVIPGKHVDVAYGEQIPNTNKWVTRTILYDVEVLAVDNLSELPPGQIAHQSNTVTVALTPEQSNRLFLASEKGKVRFTLLNQEEYNNPKATAERRAHPAVGEVQGDQPDENEPIVDVWVARDDIKAGTKIDEKLFQKRRYFESEKPAKAIAELGRYRDQVLKHPLAANQFVTEADLDTPLAAPDVAKLPDGRVLEIHDGPSHMRVLFPNEPGSFGIRLGEDGQPIGGELPGVSLTPAKPAPGSGEWKRFSSAEGRFEVLVPSDVTALKTTDFDQQAGDQVERHTFQASRADLGEFIVSYIDLPKTPGIPASQLLEDRIHTLVQNVPESKLIGAAKPVTSGGFQGREVKLQLPGGVVQCDRLYLAKQRIYQVTATGKKLDLASPEVAKFLNSFVIKSGS